MKLWHCKVRSSCTQPNINIHAFLTVNNQSHTNKKIQFFLTYYLIMLREIQQAMVQRLEPSPGSIENLFDPQVRQTYLLSWGNC